MPSDDLLLIDDPPGVWDPLLEALSRRLALVVGGPAPARCVMGFGPGARAALAAAADHPDRVERLVLVSCDGPGGVDTGRITAATLVVAGAGDPELAVAETAALAAGIPGASLQVIGGAGRHVHVDQPDRFTSAVVDHLAGTAFERGRATRRAVLGDAHVARSEASAGALSAPFAEFITRYAWGDIWTRPGLDRRTRSCITLAMLVARGRFDELELHIEGARRNGVSVEEIGEILLQSAVYCGVPAANTAFATARRVLGD